MQFGFRRNYSTDAACSRLTLNIKKTVGMYFTKSNKSTEMPSIHVNGIEIDIGKNVKYLGIHLDQTLSFKNHIKRKRNLYITSRLSGILERV